MLVLSNSNSKLTQKEIQSLTGLSIRSVKNSLKLLKDLGLVNELINLSDMRRKTYILGCE
ncbi:MAG: HTH domain-containing protein [Candidatus Aenigmarchaeota archaeon]|nr:HTH domain-containing protein [Candidatus Aenigmarchaeota archaeon]